MEVMLLIFVLFVIVFLSRIMNKIGILEKDLTNIEIKLDWVIKQMAAPPIAK